MQIGEFAKACGTKISVLRHYDKTGLLRPAYTDRFTGYRYYAGEQIADFWKITALKTAGFTLAEIRGILERSGNTAEILDTFERKRKALETALVQLEKTKKQMLEVETMMKIKMFTTENGTQFTAAFDGAIGVNGRKEADRVIAAEGYQRVSVFTVGADGTNETLACCVTALEKTERVLQEDIDLPFENDDTVIGRWDVIGEYAVREDFDAEYTECGETEIKTLYFLPDGVRYWCFGWTKGKLLVNDGESTAVCPYETEYISGERYMFVELKSYHYRRGGKPTVLVSKQVDNKAYTVQEIARKDDIDLPFVADDAVHGTWKTVDFCKEKADFIPGRAKRTDWYLDRVEFRPNGAVMSAYDYGRDVIESADMQTWTKGYILRKWNHSACAYEIRIIDGKEYLFLEWKSGDYRWGGFDTDYYVLERA